MQIDFSNPEITMLILSTDTVLDRFERLWRESTNQMEAQRAKRRVDSIKQLQEKLVSNLPQ